MEAVSAEKPIEGSLCAHPVVRIAGHGERGQFRRHERERVEWLLVAAAGGRLGSMAAEMAGQSQRPLGETRLIAKPAKSLQARGC